MKKLLLVILLNLIPNIVSAQQPIVGIPNNTLTADDDFVEFVLPIGTPSTETITITLTGTFVSTNRVDATALVNGWAANTYVQSIPVIEAVDNSSDTELTVVGTWIIGNVGWQRIRVYATNWTSGTVTVTAVRGFGGVSVGGGGGGGGTGDFTNAVFNASFGTAGTPDSQVQSIQGITGMFPLDISFSGAEIILHETGEPLMPYLMPYISYNADGTVAEFGTVNFHNSAQLVNQDGPVTLCKSWPGAPTALSFDTNLSMFNCTPQGKLRIEISDANSIPLILCNQQLTGASSADAIAIPLSGSLTTYICSMHIDAEGTVDTRIVSGTTGACTASITQMSALYAFSTTTGVLGTNEGSGIGMIMKSDPGEDVCIDVSGAVVNNWRLTYTQF